MKKDGENVSKNVKQVRAIATKLNDSHIKYASDKTSGEELIVGRSGHVNIVDGDCFELVFGVQSIFKFRIDEMCIWEFMSLDGATVSGTDLNTGKEKTYITFFEYNMQNEEYSEDEIEVEGYYFQIDIWSVEDYTELVKKTKKLLEANNFRFIDQEDLYEKDTKIFHKGLRYWIPNYR